MKTLCIPFLLLSMASATASAIGGGDNGRIRIVAYDPNQVVKIYTAIGNPTLIQFEDDETVVDTDKGMIGMGDKKAWSVAPKGSNIMLKPIAKGPDTQLLVVTTKRTYAFDISMSKASKLQRPTLILRFSYPDSITKEALAANRKRAAVYDRLNQIAGKDGTNAVRNANYWKQGDEALAPSRVDDDGRFTFFRFDSTRELPVVYKILPDGTEALTNYHMDSDTGTVVIHEVAEKFILRYGTAVMAIRNDGFNPNGALNLTGTTVSKAVRLQKDDQQ
jgi:type IV secretion system protein VirB9